ncbi:hypothetical protein [Algoriphagus boritolerans]|uniref:hypothetical protein n=1 Tax=Algoriphagus boritolerans TaxID=308111 RepID=UPI000B242839
MKKSYLVGIALLSLVWACGPKETSETAEVAEEVVIPDNSLSDEEKAQGWFLLFDGTSMEGWRLSMVILLRLIGSSKMVQ